MTEPKHDRITIVDANKPTGGTSKGFGRFSRDRDGEGGGLFSRTLSRTRSRSKDPNRDAESVYYDEGFDAPRESDFRHKQTFHGWKLLL
jgi:hypothetical protein